MSRSLFGFVALLFLFSGCGTENPFDRGPDTLGNDLPPTGPVSFSQNVIPILDRCVTCHRNGTGGWTYTGGASAFAEAVALVDVATPEESPLLIYARGGDGHGGGTIVSRSSTQYEILLRWIEDGAEDN